MKAKLTKGGCIILNYNVLVNSDGEFIYEGRAQYVRNYDGSIHNFYHFNTLKCEGYSRLIDTVKKALKSYFEGDYVIEFNDSEFGYISIDDYNIKYTSK